MGAKGTRATDAVRRAGVPHTIHEYEAEPAAPRDRDSRPSFGRDAAEALGVAPDRIYKTLIAAVDGRLAVAIVPVAGELDLKRFAEALDGRRAEMAGPVEAERATGYVIGGISPLGQRRTLPTVLDASAGDHQTIYVSAGRRGLQVELAPADLTRLTAARTAAIARGR
ncbi:MAG TPA: Cys-tRNA(Pro) deacylase [Candidatus Limnocylindrales bacterium]|nr:Cys-tRNA(Pro) deacylase [Candidatus Limnocylindrales bacterium]